MHAQTVVRSLGEPMPTKSSSSAQVDSSQTTSTSKTGQVKGVTSPNDNLTPMQKLQKEHSQGGFEIACNGWKTAGMIDIALTRNWWYAAIAPTWGAKNEYIKETVGFRLGGGLHKRLNITSWFYIDGRVGLHYRFTKITMKDYSNEKYHDGLFTFRPCIGFNLFQIRGNDFSIFGAYEGMVAFKDGSYGNSWSAGICLGF